MSKSQLEENLLYQIRMCGLPDPYQEVVFRDTRRWRFDMAWPNQMLAVEVEGGTWVQGRHNRGGGMERDCQKYNAALLLGWRVLRFTGGMVESGEAIADIGRALEV